MMNLTTLAQFFGYQTTSQQPITGFSIDSRQVQPGHVFVALKGDHLDGHHFIADAKAQGAIAVISEKETASVDVLQLVVQDAVKALAQVAAFHRQSIHCPIIALTGSNGKTTVKEMIAAILPQPSLATSGNLNNHLGVPLSVLKLNASHRYAVFELGANHPGEIAHTAAIVKPIAALINNIAPAHLAGFGSIEGVAHAKGEIYQSLPPEGTAIINDDDNYAHFWDDRLAQQHIIRFSRQRESTIYARAIHFNEQGCAEFILVLPAAEISIKLNVPGEHNVSNALAAAACCYAAGINTDEISRGLNSFQGVPGRLTYLNGKNNALIIDDTYNANLRSVLAAIDVLAARKGQKVLVLGDLGELGQSTQEHHSKIGKAAHAKGIDEVLTCGKHSLYTSEAFGSAASHYANQVELVTNLLSKLDKNTTVLVKGSRSAAMEKIVQQLVG